MSQVEWLFPIYTCVTLTSTNSWVNLNGEVSKPMFFPGEFDNMNPKSMWMMCPCASSRILPLCLQSGEMLKCSFRNKNRNLPIGCKRDETNNLFWYKQVLKRCSPVFDLHEVAN